ncbi:MAG: hypothetical protein WB699_06740 [Bacteroidota bacterium]
MKQQGIKARRKRNPHPEADLPLFCDYTCPHAAFAPADAVGACRKELAVYCSLLEKFNNKNTRCLARKLGDGWE